MRIDRSSNLKRLFKLGMTLRDILTTSASYLSSNGISSLKCRLIVKAWCSVACWPARVTHWFSLSGKNCDFQSLAFHWNELNNSISWLTDEFQAFLCFGWTWEHFPMPFNYATLDNFPNIILGHLEIFPLSSLTKVGSTLQNHDIWTSIFIKL